MYKILKPSLHSNLGWSQPKFPSNLNYDGRKRSPAWGKNWRITVHRICTPGKVFCCMKHNVSQYFYFYVAACLWHHVYLEDRKMIIRNPQNLDYSIRKRRNIYTIIIYHNNLKQLCNVCSVCGLFSTLIYSWQFCIFYIFKILLCNITCQ